MANSYVDFSDKKMGNKNVMPEHRPSPGEGDGWSDAAAPENQEGMKKIESRHGSMEAIQRRISKQRR